MSATSANNAFNNGHGEAADPRSSFPADDDGVNKRQFQVISQIVEEMQIFRDDFGEAFADIEMGGHRETWALKSSQVRKWITRRYYALTKRPISSEARTSALGLAEAQSLEAPQRPVYVRVGALDDRIYLDLGDPEWRAIEINRDGWQVVDRPLVRFQRPRGTMALPLPARNGSIEALRPLVNLHSAADFNLMCGWLVGALRRDGPYPILVVTGEQGTAKSTFTKLLRDLIDPRLPRVRTLPRSEHDLAIAAGNAHVLVFDNISRISEAMSDALCRTVTGGGLATRRLYTDDEEALFEATRPVMLNGIEDFVVRPDLAERSIFLRLKPISDAQRRTESELNAEFERVHPKILGALLDAVVEGLRRLPGIRLEKKPRMADFACWVTACEKAYATEGSFMAAYTANLDEAVGDLIETDPVASAILELVTREGDLEGTAAELLTRLTATVEPRLATSKYWPATPRALSDRVTRATTPLRKAGVEITRAKVGKARSRLIIIKAVPTNMDRKSASASSAASASDEEVSDGNGLGPTPKRTQSEPPDSDVRPPAHSTVRHNPLSNRQEDAADEADAELQGSSAPSQSNWGMRV